jgi:hypothetical protein
LGKFYSPKKDFLFMTESAQSNFTPQALDQLQRLRVSVLAFQNAIAPLPAGEQSNARNEQFNQLRLEAKALLKESGFDERVPEAVTDDLLTVRFQKIIIPRLSAIVFLGVILALLGLGINSIFVDLSVSILACLVSSGGMLLIIGAFAVLGMTNFRRQRNLTNFGDLYQRTEGLLYEINHALNMAIPDLTDRPPLDIPEIPSVVELALDSLTKQVADWQLKLRTLEEQRIALGVDAPLELTVNIDFAQRELNRVKHEIDRLHGHVELPIEERPSPAAPETVPPLPPGVPALRKVEEEDESS